MKRILLSSLLITAINFTSNSFSDLGIVNYTTFQNSHIVVKKIAEHQFEFANQLDLDEDGRSIYAQRIQGMFPFIEHMEITPELCIVHFTAQTDIAGANNALGQITKIFNYQSFEIKYL